MCQCVVYNYILLDVISGPDHRDSTSLRTPYPSCNDQFTDNEDLSEIRVGVPKVSKGLIIAVTFTFTCSNVIFQSYRSRAESYGHQ